MTSLCALFSMRWTDVALEYALLCGIPHQFPLHHWLVKILRLELGIGAEAGHLPELLPPRRLLVKAAGVSHLASVQLHHEPQARHGHLLLGESARFVLLKFALSIVVNLIYNWSP